MFLVGKTRKQSDAINISYTDSSTEKSMSLTFKKQKNVYKKTFLYFTLHFHSVTFTHNIFI